MHIYAISLYEAAKIMFNNVGDFGRLVTTLCKLNDLAGAVDAARKANTIQTWRDVCKAAIDEKEFRIAQATKKLLAEARSFGMPSLRSRARTS